jgi:hypothetical protein
VRLDARGSGTPPGGSARAGRARRTRSRRPRACCAWPNRGTGWRRSSRCWSCAADDESRFDAALAALGNAIEIGPEGPDRAATVIERVG